MRMWVSLLLTALVVSGCDDSGGDRDASLSAPEQVLDVAVEELQSAPAVAFDVEIFFLSTKYFGSTGVASASSWRAINRGWYYDEDGSTSRWWLKVRADRRTVWLQDSRWTGPAVGCWQAVPPDKYPDGVGAQGPAPKLGYLTFLDLLSDGEWDSGLHDAIDARIPIGAVYDLLPVWLRDDLEEPMDTPVQALVKLDGARLDQLVIYTDSLKDFGIDAEIRIRYQQLDHEVRVGPPHADEILTDPAAGCGLSA